MSTEIPVGFSEQYTTDVRLLLQQQPSRFRHAVEVESGIRGKAVKAVEQIGAVTARARTTRHGDTPLISTPHDARWAFPTDYEWADLIDRQDALRAIADFQGPYVRNGAAAQNRAIDDEVISALFSDTTKTGEDAATTTDWTTFVGANAAHLIAHGSVGLTTAKLIQGLEALEAAEVDLESDQIFCALSAKQMGDLRVDEEYVNWDYTANRVLEGSAMKPFLGINFIHSERLPDDGSTARRCAMWAKSGMSLCIWEDVKGEVSIRDDKSYATQVYTCGTYGSTRTEEKKVVEIQATE